MKILFIGTYEKKYPRYTTLLKGLKSKGILVYECHATKPELRIESKSRNLIFLAFLPFSFLARNMYLLGKGIFMSIKLKPDVYVTAFPGLLDIPVAYAISKIFRKKLVSDLMISMYDAMVIDRKVIRENSFMAKVLYLIEKSLVRLPDLLFTDTNQHAQYLSKLLGLSPKKVNWTYIGANNNLYKKIQNPRNKSEFKVVFFGGFMHSHGIDTIVKAAKLLKKYEKIKFILIGSGQTFNEIQHMVRRNQLSNVEMTGYLPEPEAVEILNNSQVMLGVFNNTPRITRTIQNKAYQGLALGIPVVTIPSPTFKNILIDREHLYMVKPRSGENLAKAIIHLYEDESLYRKISQQGHEQYKKYFSPDKIAERFVQIIVK